MIGVELILIGLMAIGLVVFIGEPLVRRQSHEDLGAAQDVEVDQLTLQKETLYMAIRDLDFDYHTGKVDDADYTDLRQQLEHEAIDTLRALDQIDPLATLGDELEREIAALRHTETASVHTAIDPGSAPSCGQCGAARHPDDKFCSGCGNAVA